MCFPSDIDINLPLWIYNKQLGGDLIPCERQLRSYQYLFDIIRCKHVRITPRLRAPRWALCSTWMLISETINLIINWYTSILPAPGSCLIRTVSPLKLERAAGASQVLSPGFLRLVWEDLHLNRFTDRIQIPRFATGKKLNWVWVDYGSGSAVWPEMGQQAGSRDRTGR